MIATDIDADSIQFAQQNIHRNGLDHAITVIKVAATDDPFSVLSSKPALAFTSIDFTMCDPPFFEDDATTSTADTNADSVTKNRTGKRPYPNNASTGVKCELATGGGEVAFVEKMLRESRNLRDSIKVFTTMFGHKSSLSAVETKLKTGGIWNYTTTEFCQGRTTRWGIAWTFSNDFLLCMVPVYGHRSKRKNPIFKPKEPITVDAGFEKLHVILKELPATTVSARTLKVDFGHCLLEAERNTWTKQKHKKSVEGSESQNEARIDEGEQDLPGCTTEDSAASSKSEETTIPILKAMVTIRKELDECQRQFGIVVEIHYIDGAAGIDGVHQLLQFITNKWS